jgi:hypothetical protein
VFRNWVKHESTGELKGAHQALGAVGLGISLATAPVLTVASLALAEAGERAALGMGADSEKAMVIGMALGFLNPTRGVVGLEKILLKNGKAAEALSSSAAVRCLQANFKIVDRELFERTMIKIEGYCLPIDPITKVGPLGVDCSKFNVTSSTPLTKLGAPRDSVQFWKEWRSKYDNIHPGIWSEGNLKQLKSEKSPIVDDRWVCYFPEHKQYLGQILEHHHLDHGKIAVALPRSLHRSDAHNRVNHHIETLVERVE